MKVVWWISFAIVFWYYVGYTIVLATLAKIKKPNDNIIYNYTPRVSIVISAYNEERVISRRIHNCLDLNYPKDKLEIIIGSDGSTDNTVKIAKEIAQQNQNIVVLDFQKNRGRSQVHNDCVQAASGDIICFTDADTVYERDCIRKLVRHYADPNVGAVGGELRSRSFSKDALGNGQGMYWRWEYALRRWQSILGVLTKTSGANMSIRKSLYHPLPNDIDIDQAVGPMVILQGYRVVHEPEAIAYEEFPTSMRGELHARRRFTIRALTALLRYKILLNPLKFPAISFHLISYRVVRYLVPVLLISLFISNALLLRESPNLYTITFIGQSLFYSLSIIGFILQRTGKKFFLFSIPFAFVWFYTGILWGLVEFISGKRIFSYETTDTQA